MSERKHERDQAEAEENGRIQGRHEEKEWNCGVLRGKVRGNGKKAV